MYYVIVMKLSGVSADYMQFVVTVRTVLHDTHEHTSCSTKYVGQRFQDRKSRLVWYCYCSNHYVMAWELLSCNAHHIVTKSTGSQFAIHILHAYGIQGCKCNFSAFVGVGGLRYDL